MNINKNKLHIDTSMASNYFHISEITYAIYRKSFWFLLVGFNIMIISCKVLKSHNSEVFVLEKGSELQLDYPKTISSDSVFAFKILVSGTNDVTVIAPYITHIETLEDNTWKRIRIQYCPCGANCKAPPNELQLLPGETHFFRWNLYESWCEKAAEDKMPNPMSKKALPGNYRILVRYKSSQNETLKFYKEFEII